MEDDFNDDFEYVEIPEIIRSTFFTIDFDCLDNMILNFKCKFGSNPNMIYMHEHTFFLLQRYNFKNIEYADTVIYIKNIRVNFDNKMPIGEYKLECWEGYRKIEKHK